MAVKKRRRDSTGRFLFKKRKFTEYKEVEIQTEDEDNIQWNEGRRVVKLGILAEQLSACKKCTSPLHLQNCIGEVRYGLGSSLKIVCKSCKAINLVSTGKQHRDVTKTNKGLKIWDVNTKCALAMIHTGLGPVQVGNFFSTLNIPPITEKALKSREREIGGVVEEAAKTSCTEALHMEVELTQINDSDKANNRVMPCERGDAVQSTDSKFVDCNSVQNEDETVTTALCVSFDGGWQKRGSGKCYNSLTGHATLVGQKTGKCLDFGVKSSDCRKCLYTDNNADHDCRKNFCGSAKAMESAIAVDLLSSLKDIGYTVSTITMDDDSTTIARLHSAVDANLQKNCDKNHVKKNLTNTLYGVKASNPCLSRSIINHFVKNLSYAIAQNKDKPEDMKNAINAIVPHAYGHHENCNSVWCGFLKNPDTYKHSDLPGGLDLTDTKLEQDLKSVFNLFSQKSEKLAHTGSTQGNESLNQLISTKAPKAKHFGGSESLNYRVAAGVAQKNGGQNYVSNVNEKHGLSPGKVTQKRNTNHDKKRIRIKKLASLPATKRKRKIKKSSAGEKAIANEIREGTTYCPQIDTDCPAIMQDVSSIPECILPPVATPIKSDGKAISTVTFDLETTGFGYKAEITQIAAKLSGGEEFNGYILPTMSINKKASEITGLYSTGSNLYYKGEKLKTESKVSCLKRFIDWLPEHSLLIAHNGKSFDSNILVNEMGSVQFLDIFDKKVIGFSDSLFIFKTIYPGRKSYSQTSLVADLLREGYDAHNALEDVRLLQKLFDKAKISVDAFTQNSFTINYVLEHKKYVTTKQSNMETFRNIVVKKGITKCMAERAAGSGLTCEHFKIAIQRGGIDGLTSLLGEVNTSGKPRVTKSKKVVNTIYTFFST